LLQRLMKEIALVALVPGLRQLQLVENPEAHFHPLRRILLLAGEDDVENREMTAVVFALKAPKRPLHQSRAPLSVMLMWAAAR